MTLYGGEPNKRNCAVKYNCGCHRHPLLGPRRPEPAVTAVTMIAGKSTRAFCFATPSGGMGNDHAVGRHSPINIRIVHVRITLRA